MTAEEKLEEKLEQLERNQKIIVRCLNDIRLEWDEKGNLLYKANNS